MSDQDSISWGELAQLTHKTQVERFGFCTCEEQESWPYSDCPVDEIVKIILGSCECEKGHKGFETIGHFDPKWNVMDYTCPYCREEISALDWEDREVNA
jgi:hypothetical protein